MFFAVFVQAMASGTVLLYKNAKEDVLYLGIRHTKPLMATSSTLKENVSIHWFSPDEDNNPRNPSSSPSKTRGARRIQMAFARRLLVHKLELLDQRATSFSGRLEHN